MTAGLAVAAAPTVATAASAAAPAGTGSTIRHLTHLQQREYTPSVAGLRPDTAAAGTTVVHWTRTVNDHGQTFSSTMVGKSPLVKQAAPSTTIATKVVPLVIRFSDGATFDPTVGDSCDTTPASTRVMNSPIVKNRGWSFGGTSVGTTQYVDAFQRAEFATSTGPSGVNPGYHVLLGATLLPKIVVNVPNSAAAEGTTGCGSGILGAVEVNWMDNYLRTTLLPSLVSQGVTTTTFPMFLLGNVVQYDTTTDNCCILGFHSATQTSAGTQTYGISMYDNTGDFSGSGDISVLSHEVAEWMDDPFVQDPTKPWGHIGQVNGCQANLEVGDPLSGTVKGVAMGGKTYHVQELAFASWFYHQTPSPGVNGWFSNYGKFRTAAAACS